MSILLAVVAVTIKSWCPHDLGHAILCQVSLLVTLVIMTIVLGFVLLIGLPTAYISSVSLFTIEMTSGFGFLTFVSSFLYTL